MLHSKIIFNLSILIVILIAISRSAYAIEETVQLEGFGGNPKIGFYTYDKNNKERPPLTITRDSDLAVCYMKNNDAIIKVVQEIQHENLTVSGIQFSHEILNGSEIQFPCPSSASQIKLFRNNTTEDYNTDFNDFNSQIFIASNDVLFYVSKINRMFMMWFGRPLLLDKDSKQMPIPVNIFVDRSDSLVNDGGYKKDQGLTLGIGDGKNYYPSTTLNIIGHELGHAFTAQNSNLGRMLKSRFTESDLCQGFSKRFYEMNALDESFSDITATALEFFITGKNTWELDGENKIDSSVALRYMDDPTRDCLQSSSNCSINNINNFDKFCMSDPVSRFPDPHHLAGVFNQAFYLLSTSKNWDVEKAYKIIVIANQHYWQSDSNFNEAACGVIQAVYQYEKEQGLDAEIETDVSTVQAVFSQVGINTTSCVSVNATQ